LEGSAPTFTHGRVKTHRELSDKFRRLINHHWRGSLYQHRDITDVEAEVEHDIGRMIQSPALCGKKKAGAEYPLDSSATRLSRGDPVGFPSHPCGWFSIIVYLRLNFFFKFQRSFRFLTCPHMLNLRLICLFDHMACNSIISHPYIHARVHVHTHGCAHVRAHIHSSRNHHNREGRPRILSALTPLISPQAIFFSSFSPSLLLFSQIVGRQFVYPADLSPVGRFLNEIVHFFSIDKPMQHLVYRLSWKKIAF
jgi:hypothetical protein